VFLKVTNRNDRCNFLLSGEVDDGIQQQSSESEGGGEAVLSCPQKRISVQKRWEKGPREKGKSHGCEESPSRDPDQHARITDQATKAESEDDTDSSKSDDRAIWLFEGGKDDDDDGCGGAIRYGAGGIRDGDGIRHSDDLQRSSAGRGDTADSAGAWWRREGYRWRRTWR